MIFLPNKMASVKIDGKDYDLETLSDSAKEQLGSLQYVQGEIKKLEAQIAVFKTAAIAYTTELKKQLDD